MPDHDFNSDWVDRYIRHELSEQEEMSFEEYLLEDVQLQQTLEAALAIREALKQDRRWELGEIKSPDPRAAGSSWRSPASRNGRVSVVLYSESIADGQVVLQMTGAGRSLTDHRLLEFHPIR